MGWYSKQFETAGGLLLEIDVHWRHAGGNIEIIDATAWLWVYRDDASSPDVKLLDHELERIHEMIIADDAT